jgi:nitrite reductase/ring-hydroxylating ferredoxin subunit
MPELADAFRTVAPSDTVPEGSIATFYLADRKRRISIARVDDRFYAFDDLCTCAQPACPLSGGLISGTIVTCQCHGSRFDISTGAVVSGPATGALSVYDVQVVAGAIRVRA